MLGRILKTVIISAVFAGLNAHGQFCSEAILSLPPSDGPVKVNLSFDIQDLHSIDDETETFSLSGILTLEWDDPRLAFDPREAGCAEKVYNGAFQFNRISPGWYPQVVVVNTAGQMESHGIIQRVQPDGHCILSEMITTRVRTEFDLKQFPYDSQDLRVMFELLGFDKGEALLQIGGVTGYRSDVSFRMPVPQWELINVSMLCNNGSDSCSSVYITFTMHRKWLFIARLVVLPMLIICMLSWSVFWMERSSVGDRMSASFVGILTAVAYQNMVGDILPQIAYITLIHAFLSISFLIMCATAVINLVVGACDKKGHHELGERIDHRCRWAFPLTYILLLVFSRIII